VEFLPDDQPSYDFYFTKLDGSENFPTVEQLAQIFLSEIREIQPQGPYQLCGYSKAGLVAYEIARLLLNAGESVPFLALFETWHPGFEKNLTAMELAQFRVLHIADRMQKYSRDLLQGRVYAAADLAWKGISRRLRKIGWRVARRFLRGSSQPVPKAMQQVEAIVVLKSFVPKPFPTRFILVRSDGSFETKLRDRTLGWRQCAAEGVEVFFVAGDQDQDHGTMMNKPYVRNVIEKIRPFLVERFFES
jgi:thioesterase domain-containing protein